MNARGFQSGRQLVQFSKKIANMSCRVGGGE
jgi:hypothetical protein